jgi:glycosyltransferase involved in cell wall biosynthesis
VKLSIITITRNDAAGLLKTFNSVFTQSFNDFEYIVIDGASTDSSTEIINTHADKISYWISEKDKGVYHAMNKGINKATGEYLLFLNSGDHFIDENILEAISTELDGTEIIYGNILLIASQNKSWTGHYPEKLSFQHFVEGSLPHPGSFIKRTVFDKVGVYDESLKIVADWKFFLDAICRFNVSYKHINKTIAVFYLDGLSSLAKNQALLQEEKRSVFMKDYAMFIENSHELAMLRVFKNNKAISIFVKAAKAFGWLKNL